MKIGQRMLLLLLTVTVAVFCMGTSAWAANGERYSVASVAEHNQTVSMKQAELEELYGIAISYPTVQLGNADAAGIYPETLDTLERALSYVSPYVVRQVSAYYYGLNGKRLRFSYRCTSLNTQSSEVTVGGFDPDESLILLLIPNPGEGATITGDNPMTILHEFGHAVHVMIADQYGSHRLKSQWELLNSGYGYDPSSFSNNPNEAVFISGYAATEYAEDVADTFAHAFVCNRPGMGFSDRLQQNGDVTPLGQKISLLGGILHTYFPDSTEMHNNYQGLLNISRTISYSGLTLSGVHLQYMGYPEPRYLPLSALRNFQHEESSYRWVSEIGAWTGPGILVFPDGTWGSTDRDL